MKFFAPVLVLLLVALSTLAQIQCMPVNYRREFTRSNNVFLGKALEYIDNPNLKEGEFLTIRFKVDKSWKGAKQDSEIIVPTIFWKDFWHVEIGKKYLVYTYKKNKNSYLTWGKEILMLTGCSPSRPYETDPSYDLTDQNSQIKQLNSPWFRFRARILHF